MSSGQAPRRRAAAVAQGAVGSGSSMARRSPADRARGSLWWLAVSVGAVGVFGHDASAQEETRLGGDAAAGNAAVAGQGAIDLAPPSLRPVTPVAPEERLTRARSFLVNIERASQSITRQLSAARRDRDVVRVLCLNDKLNQVDVALGSARDRVQALRTAVNQADGDRSRHEYTVLEVLSDRVRVLVNESNQCVGEETGFIGEAAVSVSVDPDLPEAQTTFDPDSNSPPPPPNIGSPIE